MRELFRSIGAGGLSEEILPVRLYHLAKRWFWDPAAIDFSQDVADWQRLSPLQQEVILRQTAMFQAGEESVTADLLPLIQVIAREGRLEEEMYLTTFLFEEAKHVEFFRRFLDAIGERRDLHHFLTPTYRRVLAEELPRVMNRLAHDPSPAAQAEAAVTYNIVVEGLLAETGYHAYSQVLQRNHILPGLYAGLMNTRRDESRHIAWGVYHCARLVAEHPDVLPVIRARAEELLLPALAMVDEYWDLYPSMPFGLNRDHQVAYAAGQLQRRMEAIERAAGRSVEEVGHMEFEAPDDPT
ncbi:MAG TPA: R2-like ligand-binding oxidase [Symbiobacteriaceae bacterium]|jgi:ribonucleoside-diphosphate reductase beta chain